ncbi:putative RING-H2 finger protein ATL71 [Fagus crenata]
MTDIAYAIGLFLFIVFIMIIKILISCCATGPFSPGRTNQISNFTSVDQHSINTIELGLDEATLRNYPKLILKRHGHAALVTRLWSSLSCQVCGPVVPTTSYMSCLSELASCSGCNFGGH